MSISSKIYKVVAAIDGSLDENYEEKETAATIEDALDDLADAIAENEILHPTTTEQTPAAETPAGGKGTETQTQGEGGTS